MMLRILVVITCSLGVISQVVPQAVLPEDRAEATRGKPGVLPQISNDVEREVAALQLRKVRVTQALSVLNKRDRLQIIAEVYPGTSWDEPRELTLAAGREGAVIAAIAEAYDYEAGWIAGVYVLRKKRPWEQPTISARTEAQSFVAQRKVWDGKALNDRIVELTCNQAPLGEILRRLSQWRTDELPLKLRNSQAAGGFLCHSDFGSRRIFARLRDVRTNDFAHAVAACIGADLDWVSPNFLFLSSARMAWRAAQVRYREAGAPNLAKYAQRGDYETYGKLVSPVKLAILTELSSQLTQFEAARLRVTSICPNARSTLREACPTSALIVQEYPTVTFAFQDLSPVAQIAFIMAIDEFERARMEKLIDRSRPEDMYVTLRSQATREGTIVLTCSLTCRGLDGKLRTF